MEKFVIVDVAEFQPCGPKCWQDALKIAVATHPLEEIRAWSEGVTCQEAEVILDGLPTGLLTVARVCIDILIDPKDGERLEEAIRIASNNFQGVSNSFDKTLEHARKRIQ